jgi:hypothetical protein
LNNAPLARRARKPRLTVPRPPAFLAAVPTVASFNGVIIILYFNDHAPPHFHARHGDHEAAITITPAGVLAGKLPAAATKDVLAWATRHTAELMANWQRCQAHQPVHPIAYP